MLILLICTPHRILLGWYNHEK